MTSEPVSVGDICYCALTRRASRLMTELYERELAPFGITLPQYSLLRVASSMGAVPVSELAQRLGLDRTTLTRNLKVLEKSGLLTLEPNRDDQRERLVLLSKDGQKVLGKASAAWESAQTKVKDGVGPQRLATLKQLVQELSAL